MRASYTARVLALLVAACIALPALSYAQSGDLRSTIRAEVQKDPRSQEMSQAELDALVEVLAARAESDGVTADDITWRPTEERASESAVQVENCTSTALMCAINTTFGFSPDNLWFPITLGILAGLLVLLLGEIIYKHHKHGHPLEIPAAPLQERV